MSVAWVEFLVEEASMEDALRGMMPRICPGLGFDVHTFQGLDDLMKKAPARFRGYSAWLPADYRVVVVIDEDREDCIARKRALTSMARAAGLKVKASKGAFQLMVRIAVEELEAWWFGDVAALCAAYPGVPATLANQTKYRDPDAIKGGTWEALERELQKAGHFSAGFSKRLAARTLAPLVDPARNTSKSFQVFRDEMRAL
jgi:hypothetical protein